MNGTIRIDRLEKCYQANVGRKHICMGSWDSCLIGGYSKTLHDEVMDFGDNGLISDELMPLLDRLALHPCYLAIADHFGITGKEAVYIFVGCENGISDRTGKEALARLRAFIDANSPTIASMDFHRDLTADRALSPAETRGLVAD